MRTLVIEGASGLELPASSVLHKAKGSTLRVSVIGDGSTLAVVDDAGSSGGLVPIGELPSSVPADGTANFDFLVETGGTVTIGNRTISVVVPNSPPAAVKPFPFPWDLFEDELGWGDRG